MNVRRLGVSAATLVSLNLLFAYTTAAALNFETDATVDSFSAAMADPQGPTAAGSLLSEVFVPLSDGGSSDFSGRGNARGAADDTGAGAVRVDGVFFSGGTALGTLTGRAEFTSEFTNATGAAAPFVYDFFLPGPRLALSDGAGLSDTDMPTTRAFYDFRIAVDVGSGLLPWIVSQAELTGGRVSHQIGTSGTNPLGYSSFGDVQSSFFGYQFDDFADSVTGNVAAGETVRVKSSLFVSLDAPGFETGGAAAIGDPLNLSSAAFSGSLNAVPIPPAVWLLSSSIAGLLGFARRRAGAASDR